MIKRLSLLLVFVLGGVCQNLDSLKYLAEQGDNEAQLSWGVKYYYGTEGAEQDLEKALYWMEKSALQGNHTAQYYVGSSYLKGHGVTEDKKKGVKWLEKSANQGNSHAQLTL
ncbi:MAG: sel1 repeat family protein, partial [Candidatus Marinimicrobia bacterium]|nr:sel1 repeat family protein [Candidatus Neomarinimicrobiota bacterium]